MSTVCPQILVIAVLMRSILHRSFNVLQWEALVLLVAGITVNQLNYCTKDSAGARPLSSQSCSKHSGELVARGHVTGRLCMRAVAASAGSQRRDTIAWRERPEEAGCPQGM